MWQAAARMPTAALPRSVDMLDLCVCCSASERLIRVFLCPGPRVMLLLAGSCCVQSPLSRYDACWALQPACWEGQVLILRAYACSLEALAWLGL